MLSCQSDLVLVPKEFKVWEYFGCTGFSCLGNYAPAMIMAGALSVTPVCPFVRMYFTYVRLSRQRLLSNSNILYQNFMKLDRIVKDHNVFFKFDNGAYRTRLSRVMALCL